MLTEESIIAGLKNEFPRHIGDDAAVLTCPEDHTKYQYVITKDLLIEDVHFRLSYQSAMSLAHKALHVNLSDIAAMGAEPMYVLLGLSAPIHQEAFIKDFLSGFSQACHQAHTLLIGGDTTRSPDKIFLSITAIGRLTQNSAKYRHTAQPGDINCVAGTLGYAHLGLIALEIQQSGFDDYKYSFLNPHARLEEGQWLALQQDVTSMMDVSDGLYTDLEKLVTASNLGAQINLDDLSSPNVSFQHACQALKLDPIQVQLIGGEDYGLLFTVKKNSYASLTQRFQEAFGYAVNKIGEITLDKSIHLTQKGELINLTIHPYAHFF